MRPLILILLSALTVEAQTVAKTAAPWLAQYAREERDRRAHETSAGRVYTTDDARRGALPVSDPPRASAAAPAKPFADAKSAKPAAPATPAKPATEAKPVADPKPAVEAKPANDGKPAVAEAPAKPAVDPGKEASARLAEQRAKVRELMDRQVALELQVSQFTSQFLSPVTDVTSQQAAAAKLTEAQSKLDETKRDLNTAQSKLRQMEGNFPK